MHILSEDRDGRVERILRDIVEWHRLYPPKGPYDGFEWHEVHADPRTLNMLVIEKVLKVQLKTNSSTNYRLMNAEAVELALKDYEGTLSPVEETTVVPPDLFGFVVGHDEKKDIINRGLASEDPVHFLLHGTVASAKTMMLEDLARLPGAHLVLGSALTRAGLFEVLYIERPKYLIIDEMDKIEDIDNLTVLLSLMQSGFIRETKSRRHRSAKMKTWVFASANDITRFPKALLSRFIPLRFRDYTVDEFLSVTVAILTEREHLPEALSVYIADKVANILESRDVRDAIKVSRLLKNKTKTDVDYVLSIMKAQK
jgi:Holliday junction DNA helicase RuvB